MRIKKEDEDTSKPTVVIDLTGLAGKSARESPLKAASSSHPNKIRIVSYFHGFTIANPMYGNDKSALYQIQ